MHITFLGTSSGMPTRQRNVTAVALTPVGYKRWYLIDCGEATQHQLLHTSLSLLHLEAVMITHIHGDHCYGLPGVLASAATYGRTEPLTIIGPQLLKDYIDAVCRCTALTLPYPLHFQAVEELNSPFISPDYEVKPVLLSHRVPSYAYEFAQKTSLGRLDTEQLKALPLPPGPLWGKLQKGENVVLDNGEVVTAGDYLIPVQTQRIIISGDNDRPDLLTQMATGADLLVHEATYTEAVAQQVGPGPAHSSAASIAKFAQDIQISNLILTHFSKRYHHSSANSVKEIEDEARRYYSGNLFLANDFDTYELHADGKVRRMTPV